MTNKLGLRSIFFGNPTVEKWRSAREAGFTDVEINIDVQLARDPGKYFEECEKQYQILIEAGITVSSFHLPYGNFIDISGPSDEIALKGVALNKKILDWAAEKKIGIAVLHSSHKPGSQEERPVRIEYAKASIKILGDYARSLSIRLAVENLCPSYIGNCADEMLILTDYGKNASICFDVNHLFLESHQDFYEKVKPYCITVHMSDNDGKDEKHWLVGDGCLDWKELFRMFSSASYQGRFIFEVVETSSPKLGRPFSPAELAERLYLNRG
jgi:sugar phosphate isomerase/epimerase